MTTLKNTMLALSFLALPMLVFPSAADARRMVPKYKKNAIVFGAQQAHKLRNKSRYQPRRNQRKSWYKAPKKVVKPTKPTPSANIKPTTTRTYVSRSLHKQAGLNYYLRGSKVRVTNVKVDANRVMFKDSGKWLGWSAKVNLSGGDSYNANGFVRQQRSGQPKGQGRVKVNSSTPVPGVIIR